MKFDFSINDIDSILSRESKYISDLTFEFGERTKFNRNIKRISSMTQKRKINNECFFPFLNSSDTGIIYTIINHSDLEILNSMFPLLLTDSIDKSDLKNIIRDLYKKAIETDNRFSLIFELTIIKSFIHHFRTEKKPKYNEKYFHNALNTLRDTLIEVRNEICSFNIFNRDFHRNILDKALITTNIKFSDSWELLRNKISSYYFPFDYFINLVSFFNTLSSLNREMEIINYFDEKAIWSIEDISNPPHSFYLPFIRDEVKSIILKTISKKSKQTREYLLKEQQDLDTQLNQIRKDISDDLKNFDASFSEEINSSLHYPSNIHLISKINSYIIDFNRKIMGNILMANKLLARYNILKKKMIKNEQLRNITYTQFIELFKKQNFIEDTNIFLSITIFNDFVKQYDELFSKNKKYILKIAKESFNELKKKIKTKRNKSDEDELLLMKNIIIGKSFSTKFNYDFVKDNFLEIMNSIENDIMISLFLENIKVFNVEYSKSSIKGKKELFYINNYLIPRNKIYYFDSQHASTISKIGVDENNFSEIGKIIKKQYSKIITSFVYDIRGSSFMSEKLRNAEKQIFIMRKYQSSINNLIKANNGFPVKETGDGGIVLFFNKSKELYRNLFKETVSSRNIHIRHSIATGSSIKVMEAEESASDALDCSLKLIDLTEKFIKDNYINYREWFYDVQEKKIMHEGMEYALLPPEFKSLFRVGIGISSGIINKDISLSSNAYGDIDVYGSGINEAKYFSEEKDPSDSIILIDHITLFNLILNSDFFIDNIDINRETYLKDFVEILKTGSAPTLKYIGDFNIELYGTYFKQEREKSKRLCSGFIPDKLSIDENGIIYFENNPVKILYRVTLN